MSKLHFERLPKEKHSELLDLVKNNMKKKLRELHDKYKLTDFDYSGCCAVDGLIIHLERYIKAGYFGK